MRPWLRWLVIGFLVVAAIGGASWICSLLHFDPTLVVAWSTVAAALAAWLTAYQALRSAQESSATARDAVRALSLSGKPILSVEVRHVEDVDVFRVRVNLFSYAPCREAIVWWTDADGRRQSQSFGALQTARSTSMPMFGVNTAPYPEIDIPAAGLDETIRITVDYRGDTGPTWWRLAETFRHHHDATATGTWDQLVGDGSTDTEIPAPARSADPSGDA